MKTNQLIQTTAALAGAALLTQTQLSAQTLDPWQTVDDFQLVGGLNSRGGWLGSDAAGGRVFSVGFSDIDTAGNFSGVINRSADGGQTWTTVEVFAPPGMPQVAYDGFAADPVSARLYACGRASDTLSWHWFVRRSDDGGDNWSADDFFQNRPSLNSWANDLAAAGVGNLYACGYAAVSTPNQVFWTVRRRDAGSGAWTTVDQSMPGQAYRLAVHPTAGVFAVGFASLSGLWGYSAKWTVRRSLNGVSGWATVDTFSAGSDSTDMASAFGIAVDHAGAVYVIGQTLSTVGRQQISNWLVRRSTNGGKTWSTVDTFRYNNGQTAAPYAAACDAAGRIWVGGYATPPSGPRRCLVRKGTPNPVTGALSWTTSDDFALISAGHVSGLTFDAAGNLFAGGMMADSAGKYHILVRKLAAK